MPLILISIRFYPAHSVFYTQKIYCVNKMYILSIYFSKEKTKLCENANFCWLDNFLLSIHYENKYPDKFYKKNFLY